MRSIERCVMCGDRYPKTCEWCRRRGETVPERDGTDPDQCQACGEPAPCRCHEPDGLP